MTAVVHRRALPLLVQSGAARTVPLAGNVAFAAVVAHRFGAAALGVAGTMQLLTRLLGEARAAGWPAAIVAEAHHCRPAEARGMLAARLLAHRRGLTAAASALAVAALVRIGWAHSTSRVLALAAASMVAAEAYAMLRVASAAAVTLGRPTLAAATDGGLGALAAAMLLAVPGFGGVTPADGGLLAAVVLGVSLAAVALAVGRTLLPPGVAVRAAEPSRLVGSARRLAGLNAVLGPAVTVAAPVVVGWRAGATEAGLLVGVLRLGIAGPVVLSVVAPVYLRRLASPDRRERNAALVESQIAALGLFAPFALVGLATPAALLAVLGPDFADAATLLRLVLIGQAVSVATGPTEAILNVSGRPRADLAAQVAGLVAVLVGLLVVPPTATGSAWALLAALVVRNLGAYAMARR